MTDAPLLELKSLTVSFATDDGTVHAVDGIDLVLRRGRTLGLVGADGRSAPTGPPSLPDAKPTIQPPVSEHRP